TDSGSFSMYSQVIKDGATQSTAYYNAVPIAATSTAEIILNSDNDQQIEMNDGRTVAPSSLLNGQEALDLVFPISTSTLAGTMGQAGYYRGPITVTLAATDPALDGNTEEVSGLLNISYKLDNDATTTYESPLAISTEGPHTISFYATDRAGNSEPAKTLSFTVDSTPPEAVIQFNPQIQDLQFAGQDATLVQVADQDDVIILTDQAGNTTQIQLQDKDRRHRLKAELKDIIYNGIAADMGGNQMSFSWLADRSGSLKTLTQQLANRRNYFVAALYAQGKTVITGLDQNGKISKTISGLAALQVKTNKGDLSWSY
ncbi:MAG TPA: chitobiase/beta-hexosaminidase C-terminal domain-containing protein, partial [Patescibacteria group bacterium]|nr:chitobiase/beta-hexosaminidase C-terminal domain-containing protein [Patescibacteria group bacterium]